MASQALYCTLLFSRHFQHLDIGRSECELMIVQQVFHAPKSRTVDREGCPGTEQKTTVFA